MCNVFLLNYKVLCYSLIQSKEEKKNAIFDIFERKKCKE